MRRTAFILKNNDNIKCKLEELGYTPHFGIDNSLPYIYCDTHRMGLRYGTFYTEMRVIGENCLHNERKFIDVARDIKRDYEIYIKSRK